VRFLGEIVSDPLVVTLISAISTFSRNSRSSGTGTRRTLNAEVKHALLRLVHRPRSAETLHGALFALGQGWGKDADIGALAAAEYQSGAGPGFRASVQDAQAARAYGAKRSIPPDRGRPAADIDIFWFSLMILKIRKYRDIAGGDEPELRRTPLPGIQIDAIRIRAGG
jgi:hypothetical protein